MNWLLAPCFSKNNSLPLRVCILDFFARLGYSPRYVPLPDFIRQYHLGKPASPFLERAS
jgi:hypothetical protein